MHRIDTPGSVSGAFSEGNPAAGQRATKVGADWLNDLQDNIFAVLDEGGVVATKGRAADLVDAIIAIVAGAVGDGSGAVPTTRVVAAAGLATGGGALSADRTITVAKATGAEVLAGTEDAKAVTPKAIKDATGAVSGGEYALLGGVLVKRGSPRATMAAGTGYIAFTTPFPTQCRNLQLTNINATGSAGRDAWAEIVSYNADGFTYNVQTAGTGGGPNTIDGFDWRAEGD